MEGKSENEVKGRGMRGTRLLGKGEIREGTTRGHCTKWQYCLTKHEGTFRWSSSGWVGRRRRGNNIS